VSNYVGRCELCNDSLFEEDHAKGDVLTFRLAHDGLAAVTLEPYQVCGAGIRVVCGNCARCIANAGTRPAAKGE
jgi:hypothetical protein